MNDWLLVIPFKPFQHSLMFVSKARTRSLPLERCFIRVGSSLTQKHYTRPKRCAREKHSSLLQAFINYGRKKFYNIDDRSCSEADHRGAEQDEERTAGAKLSDFVHHWHWAKIS